MQTLDAQSLDARASRAYEESTVRALRQHMITPTAGVVILDAIDLTASRPDTLVVFRHHQNPRYVGADPGREAGPRPEVARLRDFAIDPADRYAQG